MVALVLAGFAPAHAVTYAYEPIGHLGGGEETTMIEHMRNGVIVGLSETAEGLRMPFTWSLEEGMAALEVPEGTTWGRARGINGHGDVVGQCTVSGATVGVLWRGGGGTPEILPFGGAVAIDDAGRILWTNAGSSEAYLWNGSTNTNIGSLGGGSTTPTAMNGAGVVVGMSDSDPDPDWKEMRAFRYDGAMHQIDVGIGTWSMAWNISENGLICGSVDARPDPDTIYMPGWLWDDGEVALIDPNDLGGNQLLASGGVNSSGVVVGSLYAPGGQKGFIWDEENGLQAFEGFTEIEYLPEGSPYEYILWDYRVTDALFIGDDGRISAYLQPYGWLPGVGWITPPPDPAYMMTPTGEPIPEPNGLVVLGAGLFAFRKRRQ